MKIPIVDFEEINILARQIDDVLDTTTTYLSKTLWRDF